MLTCAQFAEEKFSKMNSKLQFFFTLNSMSNIFFTCIKTMITNRHFLLFQLKKSCGFKYFEHSINWHTSLKLKSGNYVYFSYSFRLNKYSIYSFLYRYPSKALTFRKSLRFLKIVSKFLFK